IAEGSDRAREIFQPFKRTNSDVWSYFGFNKSPEGNLIEDGHPVPAEHAQEKVAAIGGNFRSAESSCVTITDCCIANASKRDVRLPQRKVRSKWLSQRRTNEQVKTRLLRVTFKGY
ncbi:hypothetical protein PO909_025736, partial [Leuciscus waleckii]